MYLDFILDVFEKNRNSVAIIWKEIEYTYDWLINQYEYIARQIENESISEGEIIALESDFTPYSIVWILTLINNNNIIVPISKAVKNKDEFYQIAEVEKVIQINADRYQVFKKKQSVKHPILNNLKQDKHPGLILFSSGSTGKSKAAVHDFIPLLEKFKISRPALKTITFLLFDHIGGINTLFYILSNAGTIVAIDERSPEYVCMMIEKYRVELLPTTPTFLNLILLSGAYQGYDLSSLKMVTYGTETMLKSTLEKFHKLFPEIKLKQTYGLSEIGIMRTKSNP